MKKAVAFVLILLIVLLLLPAARTETVCTVNGRELTDLSIEELYKFEDYLVSTIYQVFDETQTENADGELVGTYVINPRTKKCHQPGCLASLQIGEDRIFITAAPSDLAKQYSPCHLCNPFPDKQTGK